MIKKAFSSILIAALVMTASCASWNTTYQEMGKYRIQSEINSTKVPTSNIEVFVQEYPKGFSYKDGIVSVLEGYNHKILGEAKILYKPANMPASIIVGLATFTIGAMVMQRPPKMNKDIAVNMLQTKASEMGGNAVIGASLPSGNSKLEGASGIVVLIQD